MLKLKTIYSRVVLLLIISAVIFLLLFTSLFFYTLKQEKQVHNAAREQFSKEVESLLELNSESMRIAVNDFTRSDQLVEFTKAGAQDGTTNILSALSIVLRSITSVFMILHLILLPKPHQSKFYRGGLFRKELWPNCKRSGFRTSFF